MDEFLYRDDSIRNRSSKLKELNEGLEDSVSGVYEILVITDVHFGGEGIGHNGERRDDEFFAWIKDTFENDEKEMPKFCVCLGDVAEHGLESEFKDYKKFTEKLESQFGIKTYNIIGNHDLYNAGWKNFEKHSFPYCSFYKFRTKNLTYYFLDSASGSLGDEQLTAFKRDMEYNENGREKLVFMHVPAYAGGLFYFVMQNTVERNKFISYCADNDVIALIDGHTHKEITSNLGFMEYNLPGYLEKRGWAIVSVDENTKKVVSKCYYLDE
ncbi:MAG: metallophosphoesterase [Treponema sp.]|nr:metallophosphoesterase [Treponema sp.]